MTALKNQVGGDHYKNLKIQPVEYITENGIPFIEGSVIKYVTRWRSKGGVKDLEKARHFLDILIEMNKEPTEEPTKEPKKEKVLELESNSRPLFVSYENATQVVKCIANRLKQYDFIIIENVNISKWDTEVVPFLSMLYSNGITAEICATKAVNLVDLKVCPMSKSQ